MQSLVVCMCVYAHVCMHVCVCVMSIWLIGAGMHMCMYVCACVGAGIGWLNEKLYLPVAELVPFVFKWSYVENHPLCCPLSDRESS